MQMPSTAAEEQVRQLLEGKSAREVQALCIAALRRWRTGETQGLPVERRIDSTPVGHAQPDTGRSNTRVQMHGDLGLLILKIHSETTRAAIVPDAKEVFLSGQRLPFMARVMDFVWWLARAGLARLELGQVDIGGFEMTEKGLKFLASDSDHPLAPEFLDRLRGRFPEIPEGIVLLLEDAQACLEYELLRPALVLLGVAFETAVEAVLMHFVPAALVVERDVRKAQAGERIEMLRGLLPRLQLRDEELRMSEAALAFADHLRSRRNDAAHTRPAWPFDERDEVEEFLVSAARHVPILWSLTQAAPRQ